MILFVSGLTVLKDPTSDTGHVVNENVSSTVNKGIANRTLSINDSPNNSGSSDNEESSPLLKNSLDTQGTVNSYGSHHRTVT